MKILLLLTEIFNICNYVYLHIMLLSALGEVHRFFQSEFFTECDHMLPLVISSILSFVSVIH